jgi:CRP/FNR family transcriptional regulator, cyclic AMP receptor protein
MMPGMRSKPSRKFNAQAFLDSAGFGSKGVTYRRSAPIFAQGDACDSVMYIQKGSVKLSVRSNAGREVVVAMLAPGDFFGEGCLAGQPLRMANATAMTASTILVLKKERMIRLLHQQPELADRFITHMLGTNIRIEEDLLEQLFNHHEKRLARALLLLARYGMKTEPERVLPKLSRQKLAKMVGTTRADVDFFMRKFKKLGFISEAGGLTVNNSLLSVILHD